MPHPCALQVDDALDELVNQFSDPLSFLRELVQNALDAGSEEVEISVTFAPGEAPAQGVAVVQVDDFGEGMTREIIERRLTRLFSSAKDGDKTKIGKFGIGFVSVFAIEPDAVCIDTSREGEHWRVLFGKDRRFKLLARDEPVDGTKIQILKAMPEGEFASFSARARKVVEYWCKHTRGEIRFDGELINREMDLDAPCKVVHDDGFSRIIVGHPRRHEPFFGFYNTGLTLKEGHNAFFDKIAFKVSSPHLEHTLTRDEVIEDEGYHRVVETLTDIVDGALCRRVFEALEQGLEQDQQPHLQRMARQYLYRAATWHAKREKTPWSELREREVFVCPTGRRHRLDTLRADDHRRDEILMSPVSSPLSRALAEQGATVVVGHKERAQGEFLRKIVHRDVEVRTVEDNYAMPLPPRTDLEHERFDALSAAVARLLSACGMKVGTVAVGHFDYEGSPITKRVAITQTSFGEISALSEVTELGTGFFTSRRTLVINADHGAVADLLGLSAVEPDFAAYLLSKLFFLGERLDPALDGRLAQRALEHTRG